MPPPRTPLSRERAVAAAIALADDEGLAALTMRRLAGELGVEAMSLYHHVANKDDLLDGMVDAVFAEIERPPAGAGWRDALEVRCRSMRDVLVRHPWAIAVMESRRTPGPETLGHHEAVLAALRDGGLSLPLTAHAYAVLDAYVYGFAHEQATLPFETPDDVRELATMMLAGLPVELYPRLREFTEHHVMAPGYDFAAEFDVGLGLLLDGIERLHAEEARGIRPARAARRAGG